MRKQITLFLFRAALFMAGRSNVLCIAYLEDVIKFIHKYFQKKFHSKENFPDEENYSQGLIYSNEKIDNINKAVDGLKDAKRTFSYIIPGGKDSPYVTIISDAEKMISNYCLQHKKFSAEKEISIASGLNKLREAKKLLEENL